MVEIMFGIYFIFVVAAIVVLLLFFRAAFRIENHLGRIADSLERKEYRQ